MTEIEPCVKLFMEDHEISYRMTRDGLVIIGPEQPQDGKIATFRGCGPTKKFLYAVRPKDGGSHELYLIDPGPRNYANMHGYKRVDCLDAQFGSYKSVLTEEELLDILLSLSINHCEKMIVASEQAKEKAEQDREKYQTALDTAGAAQTDSQE